MRDPGTSESQSKGRSPWGPGVPPAAALFLAPIPPFRGLPSPPPLALLSRWVHAGVRSGGGTLRGDHSGSSGSPGAGVFVVVVVCFINFSF